MLKIIDRYIGRQVLTSTLIAVTILSVVMVLGNIFKRLLGLPTEILRAMPVEVLIRFVGYALLASLPITIPWSLLTSVLLVFGRMSADNELLAIRMAGQSLTRICAPIFVLAGIAMGLCFWINLKIAPQANLEIKQLPALVATANPKALLAPDRIIDQIDDYIVYIGEREGDELKHFQMIRMNEKKFPSEFLTAKKVLVTDDKLKQEMNFEMFDVTHLGRQVENENKPGSGPRNVEGIEPPKESGHHTLTISIHSLFAKLEKISPNMMGTDDLKEKIKEERAIAVKEEAEPAGKKKKKDELNARERAAGLMTELSKRFSLSLACFVFALVGIPLGVTAQRRETSIGFALSLVIGISYMSFIILADSVFKNNPKAFPHLLVWAPNILFLGLGGWMFWRLQRR